MTVSKALTYQANQLLAVGGKNEILVKTPTNDIRGNFSETLSRVAHGRERVAITRRGKVMALIVPFDNGMASHVTKHTDASEIRGNLSDIVNQAHYGNQIIGMQKHGFTIAVIMSVEAFQRISSDDRDRIKRNPLIDQPNRESQSPSSGRRSMRLQKPPNP